MAGAICSGLFFVFFCKYFFKLNNLLGIEIRRAYGGSGPCDNSPTVDRINNKLGYIKGNVKVISWRANRIKNNGNKEELEKVISYIENNLPNGQINK